MPDATYEAIGLLETATGNLGLTPMDMLLRHSATTVTSADITSIVVVADQAAYDALTPVASTYYIVLDD